MAISHRLTPALALAVAFLFFPREDRLVAQAPLPLDRLLQWLDAVDRHQPGELDAPAIEVSNWSRPDLETSIRDARKLAQFLEEWKTKQASPDAHVRVYGRTFGVPEVQKLLGSGNRMLRRGAVLHADVAMLAPDDFSRRHAQSGDLAFEVEDGRNRGSSAQSAHWALGRSLIAAIAPAPDRDPVALLWYRAISASLLRDVHMSVALPHLIAARALFPSSWEILLDLAYLHQKFSSSEIQAAVDAMNVRGLKLDVMSSKGELEATERYFRQALALNPELLEARVRMGRVIGLLGRHEEAAAELRKTLSANPDGALRYYAEMFLAREEETLGHRQAARAAFERAAGLYPRAQSPRLALSQLARQSGDRSDALRAIRAVMVLPADELDREDPWWDYYDMHTGDAEDLMLQLYGAVRD